MPAPYVGFVSYARIDNTADNGSITNFREALERKMSQLATRKEREAWENFKIFQDINIESGADWSDETDSALDKATFLLPIITHNFFTSDYCWHEVNRFLDRITTTGSGIVVPIEWESDLERPADPERRILLDRLYGSQKVEWGHHRFDLTRPGAVEALEALARRLLLEMRLPAAQPPRSLDGDLDEVMRETARSIRILPTDTDVVDLANLLVDALRDMAYLPEQGDSKEVSVLREMTQFHLGQPFSHLRQSATADTVYPSKVAAVLPPFVANFQTRTREVLQQTVGKLTQAKDSKQVTACLLKAIDDVYRRRPFPLSEDAPPALPDLRDAVEATLEGLASPPSRTSPPPLDGSYLWVLLRPVGEAVEKIGARREVDPGAAADALRRLAVDRPFEDLVAEMGGLDDERVRAEILLAAVMKREPAEVAELLAGLWGDGPAAPDHAVAGALQTFVHRQLADEINIFLRALRNRNGATALADEALAEFTRRTFSPTYNVETAELYVRLRAPEGGSTAEAVMLLYRALTLAIKRDGDREAGSAPAAVRNLVDILRDRHPGPSVLEHWVRNLPSLTDVTPGDKAAVVAYLIDKLGDTAGSLTRIVGQELPFDHIHQIYGRCNLAERRVEIRRYVASRDVGAEGAAAELASIATAWKKEKALGDTWELLVPDIARLWSFPPRPVAELVVLSDLVSDREIRKSLWGAASESTEGRSPEDLAIILKNLAVAPKKAVQETFARAVVDIAVETESADPLMSYFATLRETPGVEQRRYDKALDAVSDELAAVGARRHLSARRVIGIALPLYVPKRPGMTRLEIVKLGETMLRKFLAAGTGRTADDVVAVVTALQSEGVDEGDRCRLLRSTVRAWAQDAQRQEVAGSLRPNFDREADVVARIQ